MVQRLEGGLSTKNVAAAVERILESSDGSFAAAVAEHSVFPLRRHISIHGHEDLFTYHGTSAAPIETYMPDPRRVFTEDNLPRRMVCGFWDNVRKTDAFGRLFRKALPGPCVVRNLMKILWDLCSHEKIYDLVRAAFKCSLLGMYREATRAPPAQRFRVWTGLMEQTDAEFRQLLGDAHQLLFFFVLKEYLCFAVRSTPNLHEILCEFFEWSSFERSVRRAMDKVRASLQDMSLGGVEAILTPLNKSKQILRRPTSTLQLLVKEHSIFVAAAGCFDGTAGPDDLSPAFGRFCATRLNCCMYRLPESVRAAQEAACRRRNFSGYTYVCLACRSFKGFIIGKRKVRRGMKIENISAYGSKEVVKDMDDGHLYCAKKKGRGCDQPLVEVNMVGYVLKFFKGKMYTICPVCGCFMIYDRSPSEHGFYCGHCRVNGVFVTDLCCHFCRGKGNLTRVTVDDGGRREIHLCSEHNKQWIHNASSVLSLDVVMQGLREQWKTLQS